MPNGPVVLLIHGMGTHRPADAPADEETPNITEDFVAGMKTAGENFGMGAYDIGAKVQLEEYNYSVYFDDIRKKLAESDDDDKSFASLLEKGIAPDVVEWLEDFEDDVTKDEALYTHWLDVLLYSLPQFGEPVRIGLAKKINQLFQDNHPNDVHIITHSLGTAVAHDTLAKIYRGDADIFDEIPDFKPGEFKLKTLWAFANVSRLLHILNNIADPNDSRVTSDPSGCTDHFYNIRHEFDPFTWYKTFERPMVSSDHIEIETIKILNTHDFKEYVSNPRVAMYLIGELDFDADLITDGQLETALEKYRQGSLNVDYEALRDAIEDIKALDSDSFKKVFEALKVLKLKIEELIDEA